MQPTSPLDGYRNQIEGWIRGGKSNRLIAALLGEQYEVSTSERSVRRALRRWGHTSSHGTGPPRPDRESFSCRGDEARFTTPPQADPGDIETLIRERGLDPDEWDVEYITVNKWGQPGEEQRQLKVLLKRKKPLTLVTPARVKLGRIFPVIHHTATDEEPELVVFVGDQHAPYHDPELHDRFCDFLYENSPERGILMGDGVDLPTISRHPNEPEWAAPIQECVNAFGQLVLDLREASPETNWVKLPGNHLERMRRSIIDRLGEWHGVTPAQITGMPDLRPFHDPVYLLRLDELGVEYVGSKGSYKHSQHMVTPYLAARHGDTARKGSGVSALGALDGLDHSIIIGHTHRQSLVQKTVQQIDRTGRLLQAGETGCMCQISDGLGYAPGPDWSNGFITASVWPDGTFKLDLGTFVDNHLYWRSERY